MNLHLQGRKDSRLVQVIACLVYLEKIDVGDTSKLMFGSDVKH